LPVFLFLPGWSMISFNYDLIAAERRNIKRENQTIVSDCIMIVHYYPDIVFDKADINED
jgi:hypothetical protein